MQQIEPNSVGQAELATATATMANCCTLSGEFVAVVVASHRRGGTDLLCLVFHVQFTGPVHALVYGDVTLCSPKRSLLAKCGPPPVESSSSSRVFH